MDKPTMFQIGVMFNLGRLNMTNLPLLTHALDWLIDNSSCPQVAKEINRISKLASENKLDDDTYFDSEIWKNYKVKNEE